MKPVIEVIRIKEPVSYSAMFETQCARRGEVEKGTAPNTLYLLQHTPVVTLGRQTRPGHLLLPFEEYARRGIEVLETDRGGDVTYHGPGQLVAYPIINLTQWQCSVGWYLRSMEAVVIRVLARYGLNGERIKGYTGVWVNGAKVAAIGVGVHQWVTFHGTALNVYPDMAHFGFIIPCGISDKPVASLRQFLGKSPAMEEVMSLFEEEFLAVFLDAAG